MTDDERRAIEADCERLIKHYVNVNDAQDWHAVADLYTEDARFARPSKPDEFVHGRAAILASFLARPARAFSVIVLYQGEPAEPGELPAMDPKSPLIGTFRDLIVRTPEGWRFAERIGGLDFRP